MEFFDELDFMAQVNADQHRDDVQEFMQVYNLGTNYGVKLASVKVFWRGWFAAGESFMAECQVTRPEWKRYRTLDAFGVGRAEALEALASRVAEFFHPVASAPNEAMEIEASQ